jgi:hypothetical protein
VTSTCRSQNRCARLSCERCSRRYSNQTSRRILDVACGALWTIQIDADCTPSEFPRFRTAMTNIVHHNRRQDRWWRRFGTYLWLFHDGRVRGISLLGELTPSEIVSGFSDRWPTNIQPLERTDLRNAVYAAVAPSVIAQVTGYGRYQRIKLAISPRLTPVSRSFISVSSPLNSILEPMPLIF